MTDDMSSAFKFKILLEENPDFDFKFDVRNSFDYYESIDRQGQNFAKKSAMQVQIGNWVDLILHKSTKGESVSDLILSDFTGELHGNALQTRPDQLTSLMLDE